jgi:hypothetical protein
VAFCDEPVPRIERSLGNAASSMAGSRTTNLGLADARRGLFRFWASASYIERMDKLTSEEMEEVRRVVLQAIEASRYPLSRPTLMRKEILAKIGGQDRRPKRPGPISLIIGRKRHAYRFTE